MASRYSDALSPADGRQSASPPRRPAGRALSNSGGKLDDILTTIGVLLLAAAGFGWQQSSAN